MNRRRFLELLGMASVGATVVYSFPSVIVPKNIVVPDWRVYIGTDWARAPRGLAYLISAESRVLQGIQPEELWTFPSIVQPFWSGV